MGRTSFLFMLMCTLLFACVGLLYGDMYQGLIGTYTLFMQEELESSLSTTIPAHVFGLGYAFAIRENPIYIGYQFSASLANSTVDLTESTLSWGLSEHVVDAGYWTTLAQGLFGIGIGASFSFRTMELDILHQDLSWEQLLTGNQNYYHSLIANALLIGPFLTTTLGFNFEAMTVVVALIGRYFFSLTPSVLQLKSHVIPNSPTLNLGGLFLGLSLGIGVPL